MKTNDQFILESIYNKMLNERLSEGMSLSDIATKHNVDLKELESELLSGIEVEKEHTDSEEEAKKIAMDHLVEDPKYYTKIKKMGL